LSLLPDCHWNSSTRRKESTIVCPVRFTKPPSFSRSVIDHAQQQHTMVLEWIVLAQPAAQALFAQVFSAQGMATAVGFYWVVHQALFGGAGGAGAAMLGALYNNNHANGGGGAAESPLSRFARPLQVVLTVTLLGLFLKWPLTSTLFAVLWITILAYTNVASAFVAAVCSSSGLSSMTTTATAIAPTNAPFLEEVMPSAVAGAVDASRVPYLSPWVWLGLAVVGSWIVCAFVADLLEDSTRALQRKIKRTIQYLVFTAPKQLVRLLVRMLLRSVHAVYRTAVRPVFRLGAGAVRHTFRWARGGGNLDFHGGNGAPPNSPQHPRRGGPRPVYYEADIPGLNGHARRPAAAAAAAAVIHSTPSSSHDADEHDDPGPPEPIVKTLINYWRDPSNKPYWDDNDDDENDEDFVLEEEEEEGQQQHGDEDDDEDDDDLRLSEYEQEDGLEVTPRRSSRLWERGL
jgi:hypothetical protein